MLRALATWTMISAVRGLATMSSTTLERLVAPRTCCGAPVARILLLGDGDLSCSAAVADAATVEVVPTTFESPASLEELYGGDARRRGVAAALEGVGVAVRVEVVLGAREEVVVAREVERAVHAVDGQDYLVNVLRDDGGDEEQPAAAAHHALHQGARCSKEMLQSAAIGRS